MGTGKSSLTSILFEELVRSPDGVIAIFYCSRKEEKNSEQIPDLYTRLWMTDSINNHRRCPDSATNITE